MAPRKKLLSESKKHYTNAEKEVKEQAEKSLSELTPIESQPPEWLSDTAQEEYKRILPLLQELPVASLDYGLVTTYCQAYADYIEANILLKEQDSIITTAHGSKLNPLHTIKRDSFNIMNSIAPKLGMSIDSRLKILSSQVEDKKDDDPFMDLMNKND